jgi:hypothetical protein
VNAQETPPREKPLENGTAWVELSRFAIVVDEASTTSPPSIEKEFRVPDQLARRFQKEDRIEWNPTKFLSDLESDTGGSLTIGEERNTDVHLVWNREPLRQDAEGRIQGRLKLEVPDPTSLVPGIYRGDINAELISRRLGQPLRVKWPVAVVVRGRRIVDLQFQEQALRVGRPTSLVLTIEAVGCGLGEGGRLEMDWRPSKDENDKTEKALILPLPFEAGIDPLVHLASEATTAHERSLRFHEQWRDSSPLFISTREERPKVETEDGREIDDTLHLLTIDCPDAFLPGEMIANVSWPQDSHAPNQEPLSVGPVEQPVESGMLVFPRLCLVNEDVTIVARSSRELPGSPKELPVVVSGPRGSKSLLLKRGSTDAWVEYGGKYRPPSFGPYKVQWQNAAGLSNQLGVGNDFRVCYSGTSWAGKTIEVFAGPPPYRIWEPGGVAERNPTLAISLDTPFLSSASLIPSGIFRPSLRPTRDGKVDYVRYDPDQEPQVAVYEPGATDQKGPWVIPTQGSLILNTKVDVRPLEPRHPRHTTGDRRYVWRGVLVGMDSKNRPLSRVVKLDLGVRVSTDWDYYRKHLIWVGIFLLGICVFAYVYRRVNKPRKPTTAGGPDSKSVTLPAADESKEDAFMTRARGASTSEVAASKEGEAGSEEVRASDLDREEADDDGESPLTRDEDDSSAGDDFLKRD